MSDRVPQPRSLRSRLVALAATGGAIAFWFGLAPISVGGDYSYVIIRGNSMEPGLHGGDFVLLRREDSYGIGDAVAYRDPTQIQRGAPLVILHRIASKQDGRFTMRGDNRTTNDNYHPAPAEVVGREIAVWPYASAIILAFTSPIALGGLALAIFAGMIALEQRNMQAGPRYRSATSRRIARAQRQ